MKQVPTILLSAVITILAIVVYDQLRGTGAPAVHSPGPDRTLRAAIDALDGRMAAVEAEQRLRGGRVSGDPDVLEKLSELDRRIEAVAGQPAKVVDSMVEPLKPAGKPSKEDVAKFRKLAAAAKKQDRQKRVQERVDKALDELGITLTADQRNKLVTTYTEFGKRRDEIWTEAKTAGVRGGTTNWDTIIADTTARIRREFTERISPFIPGSDAEAISVALNGK